MAEPNKYAKNADINPNSKKSTIFAVASFGLIILGLVGLAMEFFKENGLFSVIFKALFKSTTSMMMIPVIILILWFLNRMFSSPSQDNLKKTGNFPMYIMMAIGAYFLFRIITTGGF